MEAKKKNPKLFVPTCVNFYRLVRDSRLGLGERVRTFFACRYITLVPYILFIILTLTGCSDMAEVQDRDFALALGVSLKDDKYRLTFGLPDLSELTKGGKGGDENKDTGMTRSYESSSLAEIEDLYNHGSNKRLDYRHLEAFILDESICKSPEKLSGLVEHMGNNYQISRDVCVFYYSGDVKELISEKGKIKGGIGDYLKKLEKNNLKRNGLKSVTLGNMIDSFAQSKDILVPIIIMKETGLEVEGAAIFQDSKIRKKITDDELKIYYLTSGQGKEFNFLTQDKLAFKLKEFKTQIDYRLQNNKPAIYLTISGSAQIYDKPREMDYEQEINSYLMNAVSSQLNTCFKSDKLDYLNLYNGSRIKNRLIWISYQNRMSDFINDADITVGVDIAVQ